MLFCTFPQFVKCGNFFLLFFANPLLTVSMFSHIVKTCKGVGDSGAL